MSLHLIPHTLCFTTTLLSSTLLAISSSNIIIMWAALELNLLSIIPLMLLSHTKQETDATVKYFLAQAFGSSVIMISFPVLTHTPLFLSPPLNPSPVLIIGLATKLGAAPMHFWFPQVMSSMTWPICILLATWQKITPLFMLLLMITPLPLTIILMSALSAIVGGLMGLNQTHINAILAYSSISHLGWMIPLTQLSFNLTLSYFLIYTLTSTSLMIFLHINSTYTLTQTPSINHSSPLLSSSSSMLLLSLAGLPPLLGFSPKLLALKILAMSNLLPIIPFLILASTLSLSYYLTISFNSMTTLSPPSLPHSSSPPLTLPLLLLVLTPTLSPLFFI